MESKEIMAIAPPTALGSRSVQDEQRMLGLLRRRGVLGYSEDTEIGRYLRDMILEIASSAQTGLPQQYIMLLSEQLAFAILGMRSMAEAMVAAQKPPDGVGLSDEAERKAWTIAQTSWSKFHKASVDIIKLLGIKDHKDQQKTLKDILDELATVSGEQQPIQDAEFTTDSKETEG